MNNSDSIRKCNKRLQFNHLPNPSAVLSRKKHRGDLVDTAFVHIKPLEVPLVSTADGSSSELIRLEPFWPYTIGRNPRRCELVYGDRRVSNRHCQVLFDAFNRRIYISDGLFFAGGSDGSRVRVSLNGVFVNGLRIGRGEVVELCAGDEVSLVCGKGGGGCSYGVRIGFVIERIVFVEEVNRSTDSTSKENGLSLCHSKRRLAFGEHIARVNLLLTRCRDIFFSNDPITCISCESPHKLEHRNAKRFLATGELMVNCNGPDSMNKLLPACEHLAMEQNSGNIEAGELNSVTCPRDTVEGTDGNSGPLINCVHVDNLSHKEDVGGCYRNRISIGRHTVSVASTDKENSFKSEEVLPEEKRSNNILPPGNKFYLNRLNSFDCDDLDDLDCRAGVTLPELLYPLESVTQIFITTFTSDISWFLSCCEIPCNLPVTIACHNTERCWSSSFDKRMSVPYSDFPNLVLVYPQFPESIAFGQDRKKLGIGCHHPKLFVVQRDDTIRVIITSANLVSKQWNSVTNTVWWQDFPRIRAPDYLSLFSQISNGEKYCGSNLDFAAQLAGFMASLVVDVPSQSYWVLELAKYDFSGATGHLVASVPGIHDHRAPSISETMQFSPSNLAELRSSGVNFIGSIEASVVGLSHLFRTSFDSHGAQLKKLAAYLGNCRVKAYGMSQIVFRRNVNIPVDVNAVSVLVPDPEKIHEGDCIQFGFLPRDVAKWVAPLLDTGLFTFYGYIRPREVLETALEGSAKKVQLILYVAQGPNFSNMPEIKQPELVSAICSLVASIQRCLGLWRLQEVLGRYKWPENLETDFVYGSSSVGAVNAHFLAAFSAAAGKRSVEFSESEESDPDWGCWSASQELRKPSVRIVFPTIDRVKSASCGILSSKRLLCFSQKTWQRLQKVDILHDAIPHPIDRVGHPMHIKVGRRRFQSKTDSSSFGWVYCGSHNFSAAAWGRPISNSSGINSFRDVRNHSVLGSRLHICNYELGIIFVVPPSDARNSSDQNSMNLDDITLPYVMPAPKYRTTDSPATAKAMWEALAKLTEKERAEILEAEVAGEVEAEEIIEDEDEIAEATDCVTEKEDEKAYAETLWSQVDSFSSS